MIEGLTYSSDVENNEEATISRADLLLQQVAIMVARYEGAELNAAFLKKLNAELKPILAELVNLVLRKYGSAAPKHQNWYSAARRAVHEINNKAGILRGVEDYSEEIGAYTDKGKARVKFALEKIIDLFNSYQQLDLDQGPKDLLEILKDAVRLTRMKVSISLLAPDRRVEGTAAATLHLILDNLAGNAEKAGADEFSILVKPNGAFLHFDVADNGPGLDLGGLTLKEFALKRQSATNGVHGNGTHMACGGVSHLGGEGLRLKDPSNERPGAWFYFSVREDRLLTPLPAPARKEA